ncbi:hypothetical protein [Mesorhizobium sp.]|uniref:hypothetical protein n=1 Tax=Mesorhizobium sp. TaxID=1871066 RepID=UPI00122BB316|nr:hypothetical protein [Mesorhizobium sp.]TIL40233.1 MAG: hypothetical protein E5Y82_06875 [Mesorhizobium sp.]
MQGNISFWLGAWGALLATLLAALRFYEAWRARQRLQATHDFTSDPNIGNEVIVINISGTPVMVNYWVLEWSKRRWWRKRQVVSTIEPEHGGGSFTISPHSRYALGFADADYFDWGYKTRPGQKLWIKLHIAGRRKPVLLKVFDPEK